MREIALHLLDIAENSVAAESKNISIHVHEDLFHDRLIASVIDDGRGMDAKPRNRCRILFTLRAPHGMSALEFRC